MIYVLDASAVLTVLQRERGFEAIHAKFMGGVMSTLNLSEVLQKVSHFGLDLPGLEYDLEYMGVRMMEFTLRRAREAADLWAEAPRAGLSLADRACLALARELGAVALTSDRRWKSKTLTGIDVELIR